MAKWMGSPPTKCDLCGRPFDKFFVDGKTRMGPWGMLCTGCHASHGIGLGTGKGQRYKRTASDEWTKVAG